MRHRLKRIKYRKASITLQDIKDASTILFSVFSRYGDGFTCFKVINEFISLYPEKKYILITSPQLYPYVTKIIKHDIKIYYLNKRKNPIKLLKIIHMLKKTGVDLGFNPWSYGEESEFFATFAKKYSFFVKESRGGKQYNVYKKVREYLLLKPKEVRLNPPILENCSIREIVIAPSSTDIKKNLGHDDIVNLIKQLEGKFGNPHITVAVPAEELQTVSDIPVERFLLGKSIKKSENFLHLLETADLFIGVDAGPLHLADALGIKAIGIFGSNAAETFMDQDSGILPIRNKKLDGIFCFVRSCKNPVCVHEIFEGDLFENTQAMDFDREIALEMEECPLVRVKTRVAR